jgi:hypothetical protein
MLAPCMYWTGETIEMCSRAVERGHLNTNRTLDICFVKGRGAESGFAKALAHYLRITESGECLTLLNLEFVA